MFLARFISKVRKALDEINFNFNGEIQVLKIMDDVNVFRIENSLESYIVHYYEKGKAKEKFALQLELEKYGIETGIILCENKVVIYNDYGRSDFYRFATKNDLKDELFIKNLACWYKKLHSIKGFKIKNYKRYFTIKNIEHIKNKFNLNGNEFLNYVMRNYDNIKLKVDRLDECVVCGKFLLENVVVSKDNSNLFVIGDDNYYVYFRGEDINYALSFLDKSDHSLFINEYGCLSEDEKIIFEVVGCVINLYLLSKYDSFPSWGNDCLNLVNCSKLLERAKCLVEWY